MSKVTKIPAVGDQPCTEKGPAVRQRAVDELGRVVLPIDLRRLLGIETADKLNVGFDEERRAIILTKSGEKAVLPVMYPMNLKLKLPCQ